MEISKSFIEDCFNILRDGRNIQDEAEEEVGAGAEDAKVPFAQKVAELAVELKAKSGAIAVEEPAEIVVQNKKVVMSEQPKSSMFGDLFEDDEVKPAKPPENAPEVKPVAPKEPEAVFPPVVKTEVKAEAKVEKVKPEKVVKPVLPVPDPVPTAVDFDALPDPEPQPAFVPTVVDVVTEDDDAEDGPCEEWTSQDNWILSSKMPKYNRFYSEKSLALSAGRQGILPGGQIDFTKYFNELATLNCDITVNTFDLEVIHQKMQTVQQLRERCKQIQLHASQQYYLWERYIELFHGILCRVEYERGKQDGIYYEHMRDMEHYFCSLKALHRNSEQVMRTLDGAFECLSRQVTIAMPMKEIERYGGHSAAPRQITPEQKKYDALGASAKSSNTKPGSQLPAGVHAWDIG